MRELRVSCSTARMSCTELAAAPASMTRHLCLICAIASCGEPTRSSSADVTGFTKTAATNGKWNDPRTWSPPGVPGDDATVLIPPGIAVTLTSVEPARLALVEVSGTLQLANSASTQMLVETLQIDDGGTFQIAAPNHPLPPELSAQIVFIDRHGAPIEPNDDDPEAMHRGLIAMGAVKIYGAAKTANVVLSDNVSASASQLPVASLPPDWRVGDRLVVPSTHFRETDRLQNEVVTISALHADHIDIAPALQHDHRVARNQGMSLQVPDLDRNVVLRSESSDGHHRGHVMLMDCTDTVVQGALFADLGRTDKKTVINDPVWVDGMLSKGTGTNPRGRYPLHFHRCGLDQQTAVVRNSVVWGTPGWGAVNHSSRVEFSNDVVFDFDGAGFVAENGDELGKFDGSMAIGGNGNVDAPLDERFVIRASYKLDDDRVAMADFGYHGDGFWLQSPSVEVTNNVAAGNYGQGFFYHTVGLQAFAPVAMPSDIVEHELGIDPKPLRHWLGNGADPNNVVIQDLPIRRFDHNAAYGNFEGLKFRYTQGQNLNIFGQFDKARQHEGFASDLEDQISPQTIDDAVYAAQHVTNSWFWNNASAINISYTTNVTYDGVFIGSDEALSFGPPPLGACGLDKQVWVAWESHDSADLQSLDAVTIRGYPIPVLEQDADATTLVGPLGFLDEQDQVCGTVVDGVLVTGVTDFCYCADKLVRK